MNYFILVSLFNFSTLDEMAEGEKSSLKTLGLSYFIYLFLYSGLEFTLTFLTHLRFGFNSMDQGKMFLYIGILMALIQGGYVRRIKPGKEKVRLQLDYICLLGDSLRPSFFSFKAIFSAKLQQIWMLFLSQRRKGRPF